LDTEINYALALAPLELLDFTALLSICAGLFAVSMLILLAEIILSKLSPNTSPLNDSMTQISKILHFSYTCNCANHPAVIEKFNHFQNYILAANRVVILRSETQTDIHEDAFEVTFTLLLKLNSPDQEPVIANVLQTLISYLDDLSNRV
jgi:hypothetical protein